MTKFSDRFHKLVGHHKEGQRAGSPAADKMANGAALPEADAAKHSGKIPRPEHPTPHWVRPGHEWKNLNGEWAFGFDDDDKGLDAGWWKWDGEKAGPFGHSITVPYAHQTKLSGIHDTGVHEVVWYGCTLSKPTSISEDVRALLHFGAVDYEAQVWVDGHKVAEHCGGHVPFHCDITPYLLNAKSNAVPLVVRARDSPYDVTQPRGKQYWDKQIEGIWYYPTTGIWQTVWLEYAPKVRIDRAILRADIDDGTLSVRADLLNVSSTTIKDTQGACLQVDVSLKGMPIGSGSSLISNETEQVSVSIGVRVPGLEVPLSLRKVVEKGAWKKGIALWSPDHPNLYDVKLSLVSAKGKMIDTVETYAGMRKIHIQNGKIYLNNERFFQALSLDQGYWPNAGLTAPSDEDLRIDIERMKAIGMNGCRKHQKVEDPRFMYWADRIGYVVWGEMPSPQTFSQKAMVRLEREWVEAMFAQINFPCIISWTPFNESWGVDDLLTQQRQRDWVKTIYLLTKTLDPTRLAIGNDGWEQQRDSTDVVGFHDYAEHHILEKTAASMTMILMPKSGRNIILAPDTYAGQPVLCTEFGGVSLKKEGKGARDWGYNEAHDEQDLVARMRGLVNGLVDGGICQGYCYTQTTDTEQEVNGILTIDRAYKVNKDDLHGIFSRRPHLN